MSIVNWSIYSQNMSVSRNCESDFFCIYFLVHSGTGHADTTKYEWLTNQHRDSYASYLGHHDLLNLLAICENECKARVKFNCLSRMLQPCGPPPEKTED